MRKILQFGLISCVAVIGMFSFSSCEYIPGGTYVRTAVQNDTAPEITTVTLNLDGDTVYLSADTTVRFEFASSNQKIEAVRFLLDNKTKYLVESNTGSFTLAYNDLYDGAHTLLMEIYTATGSGSIAEAVGNEYFYFSRTWKIIVDKTSSVKRISGTSGTTPSKLLQAFDNRPVIVKHPSFL